MSPLIVLGLIGVGASVVGLVVCIVIAFLDMPDATFELSDELDE